MAEEIVFFAAKCHKSHLKAQKEAALFLRNLLELICAGVSCEKQSHPSAPPPLPSPNPPTPGPPGSRPWRRTEEFGLVIRALGFRSLNLPVEKTGGGKGNLAGPCQPGGSKQHAGELDREPRAGPWSPPRRDLCGPPPARTPRSLERENEGSRGCLRCQQIKSGLHRVREEHGARPRGRRAEIPRKTPERPQDPAPGLHGLEAGPGGLSRESAASSEFRAGPTPPGWRGARRLQGRGLNLRGRKPGSRRVQPARDPPREHPDGAGGERPGGAGRLPAPPGAALGPGHRAPGLRKPRWLGGQAGGSGSARAAPRPGAACRVQPCFGCPLT